MPLWKSLFVRITTEEYQCKTTVSLQLEHQKSDTRYYNFNIKAAQHSDLAWEPDEFWELILIPSAGETVWILSVGK